MIGVQPRFESSDSQPLWAVGAILAAAVPVGLIALAMTKTPLTLVIGGLAGLVLLGVTIWRPTLGCLVLVVAVPLTAGLGRGTVLPLVRPSEVLMAVVIVGTLVHELPIRRQLGYSALDLAVTAFAVGGTLVPWAVLLLGRQRFGTDTWTAVLAPMQYLVIFLLFSRLQMSDKTLRLLFALQLAVGTVVAIIGLAQLAALPGVREFIASTYPFGGGGEAICQFGVCRPTSLLEHWSSYGAYAVLTYTIGLALVATGKSGFSSRWLPLVLGINALAVFASQTQAAVIGLVLVTLLVFAHRRHLPRQLLIACLALAIGLGLFWPQIQTRVDQQLTGPSSGGLATPESLQTRDRYWNEFFLPVVAENIWVGTGTQVPTSVPDRLVKFVDNEYLRMALRGGVIGVGLLLLMLTSIAATGWRQRHSSDPLTQAIGAMAFAYALVLAVMGSTAEYLTYAGVSQLFWMVAGVLGASVLPAAARRLAATPVAPSLPEAERNAEAAIVAPGADVEAVAARADPAVASVADIEVTVTPTASAPKAAPEPGVQQAPVALLQRPTGARPDDGLLTEYGELLNRLLAGTAGDSAYLRILRPRVIEVAATTGSGAPFRETLRLPRPPGRPRLITSTATGGGWPAWCRARGITSAAIAPVLQGSWAVGTMVLASTGAARLSQVDLSGLALGAWMAAQAFESDQRMASLSKQLTEVQPRLKLIAALARASETGMNFPDLATAIGSSVEATYCRLASLDGSGRFQIHATAGSRPPATARGRRPSIASLPSCAEAVRTGRPVVRHFKPGSIEVERRALFSPTTLTGIIVPFFAGPDADGVLLIGEERARAQHLLPDRLGVFQQVAHDLGEVLMLAHTIEQRRVDRLEREKHVIKLNERRELARELHDDVGQALTGLLLQVRLAIEEKRADPADLRIFESAAENALEAARALSNELRRRSHGDPIDAAKRALEKLLASNGTRLTWTDVRSREALSPEVAQELALVIREAGANVARHARAENVHIKITGDGNRVEATVVDDGLGTTGSISSMSRRRGLGLAARSKAIARVGGVLEVQQLAKGGTRVRIEVPGTA